MARKKAPTLDEILAAMTADPRRVAQILNEAEKKGGRAVIAALQGDARFGAPILAAFLIPAVREDTPWLVQYLGTLRYAPAAPDLLALWRKGGDNADQIGDALLAIGDKKTLAAMAREVTRASEMGQYSAIQAVLRTQGSRAFTTLTSMVRKQHRGSLDIFDAIRNDKKLARNPTWRALALEMIRAGRGDVIESAWGFLRATLSPKQLARTLAKLGPRDKLPSKSEVAAREQRLAAARTSLASQLDALGKTKGVSRAKPTAAKTLRAIEDIVGPLPATVRAYYERFDLAKVGDKKKGVHIVSLAEIHADAKHYASMWCAPQTPRKFRPSFDVPISPDGYTRAGYSGGPAYGFSLPTTDDDPRIVGERGNPRFSELLARAAKR